MKKKHSQRWHFKNAIRNRYGVFCNRSKYFIIQDTVKMHQGIILDKQSNTRLLIKVCVPFDRLNGDRTHLKNDIELEDDGTLKLYVVYDTSRKELVTALPWYKTDSEFLEDYYNNHKYERI